MIAQC